jgi:hypothetical protein
MFVLAYADPFFNNVKSVFVTVSDGTNILSAVMDVTVGPDGYGEVNVPQMPL